MLIGSSSYYPPLFDFGAEMVKVSLLAAGPAFELQFFLTQEAVLDKLDDEIERINSTGGTGGATALIDVEIASLKNDLEIINDYKTRTDAKASRVEDTLTYLIDLAALADPTTVAEFDAKLAETIHLMQKTNAPTYERYGVQDRLRKAKTDAIAQLEALVHNNFATQGDIDAVTTTLTAIRTDYLASQSIINSNVEIAYSLQENGNTTIQELTRQATNIKFDALGEKTNKIQKKREYYSQILTAISLSFDTSQALARFLAENLVLPKKTQPGSLVNLFT